MTRLDRKNILILEELGRDGRMSLAQLALRVGLSESAVRDRLARLQARDVVRGFRAEIDAAKVGLAVRAFVSAQLPEGDTEALMAGLAATPWVCGASLVTGGQPLRLELRLPTTAHLEEALLECSTRFGLEDIDVHLEMRELVPSRPPAVSALVRDGAPEPRRGGPA